MYYTDLTSIPKQHYSVVYADPAWSYRDKLTGHSFSLDHEYPTMGIEAIKALPVKSIAAKDAVLFLWITSPNLPWAFEVMDAWGFKLKTVAFCWSKRMASGKEAVNRGRWTMGNVELCLLGVKGHPKRVVRNVRQLVTSVRGKHSEKPAEVRNRIEVLMGDVPRIELFARGQAANWDSWGNEPGTAH